MFSSPGEVYRPAAAQRLGVSPPQLHHTQVSHTHGLETPTLRLHFFFYFRDLGTDSLTFRRGLHTSIQQQYVVSLLTHQVDANITC